MGETDIRHTPTETAIEQRENGNHSSTEATAKRRGRPPGTTKTQKELLGLSNVEPKIVSIEIPGAETEPPKKKAGRPAGTTKKTTSSKAHKVDSTQIQFLLVTLSGVIASRPGMAVWNLTAEEAKQIADPLSHIMAKNEALSNVVGEHADAFALLTACFMVFLPKFIMYQATKPKKPKQGEKVNYDTGNTTQPQQQKGQVRGDIKPNAGQRTSTAKNASQNLGGQLFELIPAAGGI